MRFLDQTMPNTCPHAAVLSFKLDLVLSASCRGTLPQPHGLPLGFTGNWDAEPIRESTKLTKHAFV